MNEFNLILALISGGFLAAAAGFLGSFVLLRKMALVGDALSHVALPGIAVGILLKINPLIGAAAMLFFGVFLIWLIEHRTKLSVDTLVGVMFSLSLALGAVLIPQSDILEALFGDITKINLVYTIIIVLGSLAVIGFFLVYGRRLALTLISPDLAFSLRQKPHRTELLFLLFFALIVAVGFIFAGALLTGALIIIPAATARHLAGSMKQYVSLSVFLGLVSVIGGVTLSYFYHLPPGPVSIIISGAIFFISLLKK